MILQYQYINNFRLVNNTCSEQKPPYLVEYKIIEGYQIYQSEFNAMIFVAFDHINNQYCSFENNGKSTDLDFDLGVCVQRVASA